MSSEEQSLNKVVEDEDDLIYEMIFGMNSTEDKRGKKKDQIPPCSGPIPIPMNAKRNGPWDNITHETTQAQRQEQEEERPDMDALKNIQENLKMKVKAEEKPCRKEGADITDYFNYGFDEESWKSYCYKHLTLRAAQQKLYTNIRVQKRHIRHEEKDSCFAHPSSGRTSIPVFRQSSATIGVTGGQPGPSSEVEGHPCVSVDPINTQVVTEMPPPSNVCSLFASTALPPFIYQGGPPLAPPPYRGHSEGFGHHSASLCPRSPGVSSSIRRNMSSGVIEGAKASERFICQHHCDRDRDRFRVQRHKKHKKHEKHSNRGSDRDRENRSSSNNSREEHMRHRAPKERGDRRHSLKDSGKKKKRHRGTQTNMKDGKNHAAAGGGGGGGRVVRRDSQRTHKHKKAK